MYIYLFFSDHGGETQTLVKRRKFFSINWLELILQIVLLIIILFIHKLNLS